MKSDSSGDNSHPQGSDPEQTLDASESLGPPSGREIETIGPYRILQKIGEGGFGEVYIAEQTKPIRRRVAIKILKAGMDSKSVLARFEAERQALALMDHPNITKVLDAGETPRGLPFFVMEHVKGEDIVTYCDRNRLSVRDRLGLIRMVCDAIHHAHQKGIIHRDLKPSNILVTVVEGKPIPKVIDFGIAKALDHRLTDQTIFTEVGRMLGTPAFMSPEQAEAGANDIDIRTDVYSIGVILYQLLTGTLPFEPAELQRAGWDAARRMIREVEPARPSAKVSSVESSAETATRQGTDSRTLARQLRNELDWIVLKAMEKDRTRRYDSASSLAADLGRYLKNEALEAGPPSASYRFRKFIDRNRAPVFASAGVGVLLIAGLLGTGYGLAQAVQARKAEARQREVAERTTDFMVGIFEVSDPSEATGNTVTAREILDRGVSKIGNELEDQPEVKAALMATMSKVYSALGLFDPALDLGKKALELRKQALGADHPDVAASLDETGLILDSKGEYEEAEKLQREALAMRRKRFGEESLEVAASLNSLGLTLESRGQLEEAETSLRQAVDLRRRLLGNEHRDVAQSLDNLSQVVKEQGKFEDAEVLLRESVALYERLLGPESLDAATSQCNLASALVERKGFDEALTLYRRAYATQKKLLGEEHPDIATLLQNLSWALVRKGGEDNYEEAEKLSREALEMRRKLLGPDHPHIANSLSGLGTVLRYKGEFKEAEKYHRDALALHRGLFGNEHADVASDLNNLGRVLEKSGNLKEAEVVYREAFTLFSKLLGADHPSAANSRNSLASVVEQRGGLAEAERIHREAIATQTESSGEEHASVATSMNHLARILVAQGRAAEAESLCLRISEHPGASENVKVQAQNSRSVALGLLGRYADGEKLLLESTQVILDSKEASSLRKRDAIRRVEGFYSAWEKKEPGQGHGRAASEWRGKLAEFDAEGKAGT